MGSRPWTSPRFCGFFLFVSFVTASSVFARSWALERSLLRALSRMSDLPVLEAQMYYICFLSVLILMYHLSARWLYGSFPVRRAVSDLHRDAAIAYFVLSLANSYYLSSPTFAWFHFMILLSLLPELSSYLVSNFSEFAAPTSAAAHSRLFVFDIVLFFLSLRLCFYFLWATRDHCLNYVFANGTFGVCFASIVNLIRHCLLCCDVGNRGSSLRTIRIASAVNFGASIIEYILSILLVVYSFFQWQPALVFGSCLAYGLVHFLISEHEYQKFRKWETARKPLDALPHCSSVDLMRQECCIICRQKMSPGSAKRLCVSIGSSSSV
jgi:hypothetical protein